MTKNNFPMAQRTAPKMARTTTEFAQPAQPARRRITPTHVPTSPVSDLSGLPQIHPDGSVRLTPLPKPKPFVHAGYDQLIKQGLQRPQLTRESTMTDEVDLEEGDMVVENDNGSLTLDVAEDSSGEHTPIKADKVSRKRVAQDGKPLRKKRKKEEAEVEHLVDEEEEKAPEGFSGLKGWKAVGGVTELMKKFENGDLKNGAWVQYTRAASTFIPSTRYKKLQEEAKHKGLDLAQLVEDEKKAMTSKGRKKALCSVSLGVDENEGSLVMSSIPPKGGRASNFYPYQQRTWLINSDTDGDIVMYLKAF